MSSPTYLGSFVNLTRTYHVFSLPGGQVIEVHSSEVYDMEPLGSAKRIEGAWRLSWNVLVDSAGRWQRDMATLLSEFMEGVSVRG